MDIGVMTFGTLLTDPFTGERVTQRERLSEVVEGAVLAEELGFAWYAVGEHHFGDRDLISSPPVGAGRHRRAHHVDHGGHRDDASEQP